MTISKVREGIYLSIVIPVFNEEGVIPSLNEKLMTVLKSLDRTTEVIYINDGSEDQSGDLLMSLAKTNPIPTTVINFRTNYGQTAGLEAGFQQSSGDIIIALDVDLQHDPFEIPNFIAKIEEGYDLVSGWRQKRVDSLLLRRLPSLIANNLVKALTKIPLHDFGTTFKAYRRGIIEEIHLYGEMHRFIPVLAAERGAKICEIPIKNIPRAFGESKYGFSRSIRVMCDILTLLFLMKFGTRPMHFLGIGGLFSILAGGIVLVFIIAAYLISGADFRGTMQLTVMAIILGIQLLATGLIAEMLTRTHHESTGKRIYTIRSTFQNDETSDDTPQQR